MDNRIKLNLLGQGGICHISIDIVRNFKKDIIIEYIYDDSLEQINLLFNNVLIKDTITNFINDANKYTFYFNCLGNINAIDRRIQYSKLLQIKKAQCINLIHPHSYLSNNSDIGDGNLICPNVIINTNVNLGNENIIFSNSVIEHDSIIGNFCYLSPSVTICGKVVIDDNVYIGPNAVITAGRYIGRNAIIGAGAVVLKDIPDNTVYVGNPAKYLKQNELWGNH